ncbi:MAG: hypothetical protein LUH36_03055 [Oscillospiraceae bacterium]|nr:hypothetical protein [Oscillospiraceae bacterium]
MERICFRPFYTEFSRVVMISVALMTMLQQTATILSGSQTLSIQSYAQGATNLGITTVSNEKLVTFAVGGVLLLITLYIVYRTKLGMEMEAVAQDRLGASFCW